MAEPYLSQITMFAGTFAPRNWAFCDGTLIAVNQNQALFALLGTTYGGDGRTNFGLPDLRGRIPIHFGQGPGLTDRSLGAKFGNETVTLENTELPIHQHTMQAANVQGTATSPQGNVLAVFPANFYAPRGSSTVTALSPGTVGNSGGNQSHDNLMPSNCVNFIIALQGIFPPRS